MEMYISPKRDEIADHEYFLERSKYEFEQLKEKMEIAADTIFREDTAIENQSSLIQALLDFEINAKACFQYRLLSVASYLKYIKPTAKGLNAPNFVMNLLDFLGEFWRMFYDIKQQVPSDDYERVNDLFEWFHHNMRQYFLKFFDGTTNASSSKNGNDPLTSFIITDVLFYIRNILFAQIYFRCLQFRYRAEKCIQFDNEDVDLMYINFEREKGLVLEYLTKIEQIHALAYKPTHSFPRYFSGKHLEAFPLNLDQPGKILKAPDFSNSKVAAPLGAWQQGAKVSYAVQYYYKGLYTKLSDWSKPFFITDKANPEICLPASTNKVTKRIYRKFDDNKPELVGRVIASKKTLFRDIDRDLYNAAGKRERAALEECEILLKNGANASTRFENERSAIHAAACAGNVNFILKCFLQDVQLDIQLGDKKGYTALHLAAENGHEAIVRVLLAHGADVRAKAGKAELTALHLAAYKGHRIVLKILMKFASQLDYQPFVGYNWLPHHWAAFGGTNAVNALTESTIYHWNTRTADGVSPLHVAVLRGDHKAVKALLRNQRISIETPAGNIFTAFYLAIMDKNISMMKYLLAKCVIPLNVGDSSYEWSALHFAVATKSKRLVSFILNQKNINVNATATNNFTPLHLAAKLNLVGIAGLLLMAGAMPDAPTKSGLTPLHVAAKYNCKNVLQHLVEQGANLELRTKNGLTPLLMAATSKYNTAAILMYLIENHCDLTAQNPEGLTFVWLAAQQGNIDTVSFLVKNCVGSNLQDMQNNNLLHHAVKGRNFGVVVMLVKECNFDVNALNSDKQTPLHLAENLHTVEYLLDQGANIDAKDNKGATPLFVAVKNKKFEISERLLRDAAILDNCFLYAYKELFKNLIRKLLPTDLDRILFILCVLAYFTIYFLGLISF